jgi:hypothetical protein
MATVDQVSAVYIGYFGRAPDTAGKTFWVSELNEGVSQGGNPAETVEEMASGFRFSEEAQEIYPFLDPAASLDATEAELEIFVDNVFDNLFNRVPDTAGANFWIGEIQGRLSNGLTIGDVIVDVMAGANGIDVNTLQNKVQVAKAYTEEASTFDVGNSVQIIGSVGSDQQSVSQALARIGSIE